MTAPTPRDTGPALDPRAVEAAAEALRAHDVMERRFDLTAVCACGFDFDPLHFGDPWTHHQAEVALTAAAPFLRAEGAAAERQRIAAAIRAQRDLFDRADAVWIALDLAAVRIADPGTTAPTEGNDRD